MTASQLKASILDLAIRGKLVAQDPKDEPAAKLLERIREKAKAKGEGEQRKRSSRSPAAAPIAENEKPFDLPVGWEWVRLGDVADIIRGSGIKRSETTERGVQCVRYGEIYTTYGYCFDSTKSFVPPSLAASCHEIHYGDVLCTLTGEWKEEIAKATAFLGKSKTVIGGDLAKITNHPYDPKLLVYFFFSPYLISLKASKANGDMIVHIGKEAIEKLAIPLPPLAEQARIVARVEELLPLVEEYGAAFERRRKMVGELPEKLRKSILQRAIEGKLVAQDPDDEPASELLAKIAAEKARLQKNGKAKKEKPLPPIADDEKPFDLPDGWAWVRLGGIVINRDSERIPLSKEERVHLVKTYDYYGASGVIDRVDKYLFDKPLLLVGEDGANLLARSTPIAFFATGKYWVNNHAHVLDAFSMDLLRYLALFINAISLAPYVTGTAQPKMNQEKMNSIVVPLPPLAEQKRIVAKVESLLADVERLKKSVL